MLIENLPSFGPVNQNLEFYTSYANAVHGAEVQMPIHYKKTIKNAIELFLVRAAGRWFNMDRVSDLFNFNNRTAFRKLRQLRQEGWTIEHKREGKKEMYRAYPTPIANTESSNGSNNRESVANSERAGVSEQTSAA